MRLWNLAVAVAAIAWAVSAGCSSDDDGGAVITLLTPAGTATASDVSASPGASPTQITAPELVLSTIEVYQAGAVLVSVTGSVSSGSVTFLGRVLPLTRGAQSFYAFVPVDTDDPTGPQPLRADFVLTNGAKGSLSENLTVLRTRWEVDSLTFTDTQTETLLDPAVVANEASLLKGVYANVSAEKRWSGAWQLPVDGPVTARYGEQRSINGSTPSGHHGGTDLGVMEGTPVHATNGGKVVLARQLHVRGNMVIIDHGGGLFSGYAHLSAINVTEGQVVSAGDIIAMSGNTGLSTGAHLHWEMSAGGVLLDALRFTDGTNGF